MFILAIKPHKKVGEVQNGQHLMTLTSPIGGIVHFRTHKSHYFVLLNRLRSIQEGQPLWHQRKHNMLNLKSSYKLRSQNTKKVSFQQVQHLFMYIYFSNFFTPIGQIQLILFLRVALSCDGLFPSLIAPQKNIFLSCCPLVPHQVGCHTTKSSFLKFYEDLLSYSMVLQIQI